MRINHRILGFPVSVNGEYRILESSEMVVFQNRGTKM